MSNIYATGTDVEVYLTKSDVMPDFSDRQALTPLDVTSITMIEEGSILPLHDWAEQLPKHMAYGTRLVTGMLQFNFSAHHLRHRQGWAPMAGTLGSIRDATLWVRLTKVEYQGWGDPVIIRDTYRLDSVWEHAFQHTPDPSASESVPFTARSIVLAARQRRVPSLDAVGAFASESDVYKLSSGDAFRSAETIYPARVLKVQDADTFKVWLPSESRAIDVRLVVVDTPETPKPLPFKQNQENDASWRWPYDAPAVRGTPGESPTVDQLDAWGTYTSQQVFEAFGGSGDYKSVTWWNADKTGPLAEAPSITLIRDEGATPTDNPGFDPFDKDGEGRYLFHVRTAAPLAVGAETTTDLSAWLLAMGYAVPFYTTSITINDDGPYNRMTLYEETYQKARDKAGTDAANGIWYSFDVTAWTSKP